MIWEDLEYVVKFNQIKEDKIGISLIRDNFGLDSNSDSAHVSVFWP